MRSGSPPSDSKLRQRIAGIEQAHGPRPGDASSHDSRSASPQPQHSESTGTGQPHGSGQRQESDASDSMFGRVRQALEAAGTYARESRVGQLSQSLGRQAWYVGATLFKGARSTGSVARGAWDIGLRTGRGMVGDGLATVWQPVAASAGAIVDLTGQAHVSVSFADPEIKARIADYLKDPVQFQHGDLESGSVALDLDQKVSVRFIHSWSRRPLTSLGTSMPPIRAQDVELPMRSAVLAHAIFEGTAAADESPLDTLLRSDDLTQEALRFFACLDDLSPLAFDPRIGKIIDSILLNKAWWATQVTTLDHVELNTLACARANMLQCKLYHDNYYPHQVQGNADVLAELRGLVRPYVDHGRRIAGPHEDIVRVGAQYIPEAAAANVGQEDLSLGEQAHVYGWLLGVSAKALMDYRQAHHISAATRASLLAPSVLLGGSGTMAAFYFGASAVVRSLSGTFTIATAALQLALAALPYERRRADPKIIADTVSTLAKRNYRGEDTAESRCADGLLRGVTANSQAAFEDLGPIREKLLEDKRLHLMVAMKDSLTQFFEDVAILGDKVSSIVLLQFRQDPRTIDLEGKALALGFDPKHFWFLSVDENLQRQKSNLFAFSEPDHRRASRYLCKKYELSDEASETLFKSLAGL